MGETQGMLAFLVLLGLADGVTLPVRDGNAVAAATAKRLAGSDRPTVYTEFGALARETGAVNLGQGFPDWAPPDFVLEAANTALSQNCHQYTRTAGHIGLVHVLAERYSRHLQRLVDPMDEVAITVGASQALFLTIQALVNEGDEVVLIEPAFDLYYGQVRVAGARSVGVPMSLGADGEWRLDEVALRASITDRSRILILNSPHNPSGKVFSLEEMEMIASVVRDHPNLIVISDEVYKYIVHRTGASHHHFATLPGMADRTVTVSSAGKTFSVTGWQVGWCVGPPHLIKPIQTFLPYTQFCVATPMQQALSIALTEADKPLWDGGSYYDHLRATYADKRDRMNAALHAAGIRPLPAAGGFFIMGDISGVDVPDRYLRESTPAAPVMSRSWATCRYLAKEHGVILLPGSPFFSTSSAVSDSLVRVAFCKTAETLDRAAERLRAVGVLGPGI